MPQCMGSSHSQIRGGQSSVPDDVAHQRSDERGRRRSLETEASADRVVSGLPLLCTHPCTSSHSRGGVVATVENRNLPIYVAPNHDPRAIATDAFSLDWNRWKTIFLFPPYVQI